MSALGSVGIPYLLGRHILGMQGLGFDFFILDLNPSNGSKYLNPSADEVLVLPGSIGTFIGDTHEAPYIELAGLFGIKKR